MQEFCTKFCQFSILILKDSTRMYAEIKKDQLKTGLFSGTIGTAIPLF